MQKIYTMNSTKGHEIFETTEYTDYTEKPRRQGRQSQKIIVVKKEN